MNFNKAILSFLIVASTSWMGSSAIAQMTVVNQTPATLIQNVFIGGGVPVLNITSGSSSTQQLGRFDGGLNIIGIDSGVVMSSGNIASIPVNGFASTGYFGLGDADVLAVAQSVPWGTPPGTMRDRAVIEFDFVAAQSDSISFEYAFGSEEWPSYPCSVFNDAFGFFISGPGITGTYSNNAVNVSIVPGTTNLPVAITSIHNGTGSFPCNGNPSYPQYYNDGPVPNPFTFAGSNPGQFSGAFTDVFATVPIPVNACDTYHVKLAICDGVDWIFDSAVFLKAKSFQFTGITATPSPSYNPYGADTALYEGCGDLVVDFSRVDTNPNPAPLTLTFQLAGTATGGLDYSLPSSCVPNNLGGYDCSVTFAAGVDTASISFDILGDALNEGIETFLIVIDDPNVTSCDGDDTTRLTILDQPDLQIQTFGNTTLDCADDSASIGVTIVGGLPPFTYNWNTGAVDSSFNVSPPQTSSYNVTVEDACGSQQEVGFVTVGVFNMPWSSVKFGDKQTLSCISPPVDMGVSVVFNDQIWHGDIEYLWSNGSTDSTITVFSTVDTTYSVTIERVCTGETVVHTFDLYTYNDPIITQTKDIGEGSIECPLDTSIISVNARGGYPPYNFQWNNGGIDSTTKVWPATTSTFFVTVTDVCGLVNYTDEVLVNVPVADPIRVAGAINDTVPCKESKVHFGPVVPSGGFGSGYLSSWNDFKDTELITQGIIYAETPFTVKVTDVCRFDTLEYTVLGVIAKTNDLKLELTNDTVICLGDSLKISGKADKGGGEYYYKWADGVGGRSRIIRPTETTTYKLNLTDNCDSVLRDEITVMVDRVDPKFNYQYLQDYEVELTGAAAATSTIVDYYWTLKGDGGIFNSNEQNPIISLPDGQPYKASLEVTDSLGCKGEVSAIIETTYRLYVPTGFTPNNDNLNDFWEIGLMGVKEFKLEIFDRWGTKVYSTTDKKFRWNGQYKGIRLPMGAYAWKMVILTDSDEYVEKEGVINILNDFQQR